MPEPVTAALLGCDHPHSRAHLETLVTLDLVNEIELWDPDPAAAERLALAMAEPTVSRGPDQLDDLLAEERVRWIVCCVRNDLAPDVLLRCAAAGKPVLAEKPLGRGSAEVAPVVEAFRQAGLSLAVCFQNRYKPGAGAIWGLVQGGFFGRLTVAETRLHTTHVRLRDPSHWLFDRARAGGGILPWLGCHYLDLLRYLLGAEVSEVTAQCATLSGEAIDVEDAAVLTLRFDNGCLATASFGYLMPGGQAGYLNPGYDMYLGLKGTLGGVSWDLGAAPQVIDAVSHHPLWRGAPIRRMSFDEERARAYGQRYGLEFARDCLLAALDGGEPPASGDDMLAVWRIIEQAYDSAGRPALSR